jgi:hypothetical protein
VTLSHSPDDQEYEHRGGRRVQDTTREEAAVEIDHGQAHKTGEQCHFGRGGPAQPEAQGGRHQHAGGQDLYGRVTQPETGSALPAPSVQ